MDIDGRMKPDQTEINRHPFTPFRASTDIRGLFSLTASQATAGTPHPNFIGNSFIGSNRDSNISSLS